MNFARHVQSTKETCAIVSEAGAKREAIVDLWASELSGTPGSAPCSQGHSHPSLYPTQGHLQRTKRDGDFWRLTQTSKVTFPQSASTPPPALLAQTGSHAHFGPISGESFWVRQVKGTLQQSKVNFPRKTWQKTWFLGQVWNYIGRRKRKGLWLGKQHSFTWKKTKTGPYLVPDE